MSAETLTLSQCKEYIKNIKDLEVSCYQQEKLLQELKRQPAATQRRISELEDQLKKEKEPAKPFHPISSVIMSLVMAIIYSFLGAIVGIVIALIVKIIVVIFHAKIHLFLLIHELFTSPWLPYITWGAIIGYVVAFVACLYWFRDVKKEAVEERKAYPQELDSFHKKQDNIKNLIECKKENLKTAIPQKILECENNYKKTKKILQDYYNLGFIYPKYRSLVPMCTIYEYLESGRCFSLLGHEGAYNLYESELRMNTIIGKLDDIIYRLDEISANQRLLAREIKRSNEQLDRIYSTLNNIEHNTALTQYYSSVTASNTTYMSWLAAFSYDENKRIQSKNSI